MSPFRILAACALLAAVPARAAEPPTVEASPRFADFRARASLIVGFVGAAPLLSATGIFGQRVAVDLSGLVFPSLGGGGGPIIVGALQAGPNFRFGSWKGEGAGNVTDVRLLAGANVTTAVLESFPPKTVYIPGFICSTAVEWTHWVSRWLGVSAELAATAGISQSRAGIGLRASVGLAF